MVEAIEREREGERERGGREERERGERERRGWDLRGAGQSGFIY